MKFKLILLLSLFCINVFGQDIPESKVPAVILKIFKQKNSKAEDTDWQKTGKTYVAEFYINELKNIAEYDKTGVLLMKKKEIDPENLITPIKIYVKENYKSYKYDFAEYIQKGKEKYYSVLVYKKEKKVTDPPITTLQFSISGNLRAVFEPESDENKNEVTPKATNTTILPESKVPEIVLKNFKRKNSRATNAIWQKKDYNYFVRFMQNGMKGHALYDHEGIMLNMITDMDLKKLTPPMQNYIGENFKGYKYEIAKYNQIGRKEKFISVFIYPKKSKVKNPALTEVQFTTTGRYLTAYEPDIEDEEEGEDIWADDNFDEKIEKDADDLKDVEEQNISKKELPSPALDYLNANFDYDWRWEQIMIKSDNELGNVYYVLMKKEGNKERVEHYFDFNGKLLKKLEF